MTPVNLLTLNSILSLEPTYQPFLGPYYNEVGMPGIRSLLTYAY